MLSGSSCFRPEPFWYQRGMAMALRLPPEIEAQLKQVAEAEHRSVRQTILAAIEEYLSARRDTPLPIHCRRDQRTPPLGNQTELREIL